MVIQSSDNHRWFLYTDNSRINIHSYSLMYDRYDVITYLRNNESHRLDCEIEKEGDVYFITKLNFIFYPIVEQVLFIGNKEVLRFAGTASRYKKEIDRFSSMVENYEWVSEIKNIIVKDYRYEI